MTEDEYTLTVDNALIGSAINTLRGCNDDRIYDITKKLYAIHQEKFLEIDAVIKTNGNKT